MSQVHQHSKGAFIFMLVQFFALLVQLGQVHFFALLVHLRQVHPLKNLYAERLLVELNALSTYIFVDEATVCQFVRRAVVQCTVGE